MDPVPVSPSLVVRSLSGVPGSSLSWALIRSLCVHAPSFPVFEFSRQIGKVAPGLAVPMSALPTLASGSVLGEKQQP